MIQSLRAAARQARESAFCPYSDFAVGAAVMCADGEIHRGCNVENASYGLTMCAERCAIFSAVAAGRTEFAALALVTSAAEISRPCGACRQVIAQFSSPGAPITVISESISGEYVVETIEQLLPSAFTL
jgi:cytidine deaminase